MVTPLLKDLSAALEVIASPGIITNTIQAAMMALIILLILFVRSISYLLNTKIAESDRT